jgi:hypothetical protein
VCGINASIYACLFTGDDDRRYDNEYDDDDDNDDDDDDEDDEVWLDTLPLTPNTNKLVNEAIMDSFKSFEMHRKSFGIPSGNVASQTLGFPFLISSAEIR